MKRPLFWIGVAFACGTGAAFFGDPRQGLLLSGALAVTGALLLVLRRQELRLLCLICLSAALGLTACALHQIRYWQPFQGVDGQVLEMEGLVLSAENSGRATAFTVQGRFLSRPDLPDSVVQIYNYGSFSCEPGETVRFLAQVRQPDGTVEMNAKGIRLVGAVQGMIQQVDGEGFRLRRGLLGLRAAMERSQQASLPAGTAEMIGAMTLGLGGVNSELYSILNRSGTAHLLSVSGLHLSVLTAYLLALLKRLRVPQVPRCLLTVLGAFLFAGLVGFTASVMRAFLMTALALLSRAASRRGDSLTGLGLALLLLCIFAPHWTLGRGLWLSATSTLGILLFAPAALEWLHGRLPARSRFLRLLLDAAVVSLCAYACSLPVLLLSTGWFSLVSPLANMLVAPFIGVMLLGGMACSLAFLPARLLGLCAWATQFATAMMLGISRWFASLPFAAFALNDFYLLILLGGIVAGILVFWKFGGGKELVAVAASLLLISYSAGAMSLAWANRNTLQLVALEGCDVAVLIRQDAAVLLGTPTRRNAGLLIRYLDYRGVNRIHVIAAPTYPNQVDSGLLQLEARYGIDCLLAPDDAYLTELLQTALPAVPVFAGGYAKTVALDGAVITTQGGGTDIKVQAGGVTVLKTGAEYAIMDRYRNVVQVSGDGYMSLPQGVYPQVEPLGRHLFGETRILLEVEPGALTLG